jgi:ParB-like chromosome segregation protein Spo0J
MIGVIDVVEVLVMLSPDTEAGEGMDVADVLPRKRQSPHYARLMEEIRREGITVPVVIDFSGAFPELLEGHHRVAAAVDLGLPAVPWSSVPLRIDD